MNTHSLIVSALLAISLAAQAGAVPLDEVNPANTTAALNAVLHKEVGLQQGGGNGKDVEEAQLTNDCKIASGCANSVAVHPPKVQTLNQWFAVRQNSSSEANPLIAILLILLSTFFYLRRSVSTK